MATVAPPARTDIAGTPSNAVAKTAFGVLHDYLLNLLGSAGSPAAARTALGSTATGDALFTTATAATARTTLDVYDKSATYSDTETDTAISTAVDALQGAAFSAYMASNQTVTSGVATKADFDTEEFDIGSCYDTTNKRWTPNKAGYYYIGASINNTSSAGSTDIYIFLYKNNANYRRLAESRSPTPILGGIAGGTLVYMNGTTDYVEIFPTLIAGGSCSIRGGATFSCFYGYFVRS